MKRGLTVVLVFLMLFSFFAISEVSATVYVSSKGGTLHLRQGASVSSASLGIVKHGDSVYIYETGDEWSFIYVPRLEKTGYLKTKYLIADSGYTSGSPSGSDILSPSGASSCFTLPAAVSYDMNADGSLERFVFEERTDAYASEYLHLSVYENGVRTAERDFEIMSDGSAYFAKLDHTGRIYIFVTGDQCSSDYITECMYYENKALHSVGFSAAAPYAAADVFPGAVSKIENGVITLTTVLDVLGTRAYTCDFTMGYSRIEPLTRSVWTTRYLVSDPETWEYISLTATCDLPITAYGMASTLPSDTRILVTAVDSAFSTIHFVSEHGLSGTFSYSAAPDSYGCWGITIGGIFEENAFEYVPYAG